MFTLFNLAPISRVREAVLAPAKVNTAIFKFVELYGVISADFTGLFSFFSDFIAAGAKFYNKFSGITGIRSFFSPGVNSYIRRANPGNSTMGIRIFIFFAVSGTGTFASFSLSLSNSLSICVVFSYLVEYVYSESSRFETSSGSLII